MRQTEARLEFQRQQGGRTDTIVYWQTCDDSAPAHVE